MPPPEYAQEPTLPHRTPALRVQHIPINDAACRNDTTQIRRYALWVSGAYVTDLDVYPDGRERYVPAPTKKQRVWPLALCFLVYPLALLLHYLHRNLA